MDCQKQILKALKRRIYRAKITIVQKVRRFYNDYRVWLTQLVAMYIIGSDEWHQKAEDWEEFKYLKNTSETSTFRAKALRWKVNDDLLLLSISTSLLYWYLCTEANNATAETIRSIPQWLVTMRSPPTIQSFVAMNGIASARQAVHL